MSGRILISTAYLPPVEYFSVISRADEILVEKEENYLKQTYRNRCNILSSHGPQLLSVPVYLGSLHKTPLKEIRIDRTKRWQQVHLRAMTASYSSSPYFEYYYDRFEKIITQDHEFLIDMNMALLEVILKILNINKSLSYTTYFEQVENKDFDFRYTITPKKESAYIEKEYLQVFETGAGFVPRLSVIDLIFNVGPESCRYL
jgi:hypothetical protein